MKTKFTVFGIVALYILLVAIGGSQYTIAGEPHGIPISDTYILGELILPDDSVIYFAVQEGTMSLQVELPENEEVSYLSFAPALMGRTPGHETLMWLPMGVGDFGVAQIKRDGTLMRSPSGPSERPLEYPLGAPQKVLFDGQTFQLKVTSLERRQDTQSSDVKVLLASDNIGVGRLLKSRLDPCVETQRWVVCAIGS